jgi:DHA2 family methylenomycin A resistance protein-like MFS transporter
MATQTTSGAAADSRGRRGRSRHRRGGGDPLPRWAWTRLAVCTAAAALLQIDGTLITVALPKVGHGLGVSSASTASVLSVYFAAYALVLLPAGELVDRLGARRVALAGLGLFAAGAAAGALSPSFGFLLFTRAVQGAAAGLVSPAALAGAVSGFPPERRGSALGIWGASAGAANLIGPLLGGLLTVLVGWRANWWALVPMSLGALWGIAALLPASLHSEQRTAGGSVLNEVVVGAAGVATLTFAVMIGTFYLAEQYLQKAVGYSALGASSVLVFVALLVGLAAPLAGRLADRRGERVPALLGFLGAALGLGILGIPGVSLHSAITAVLLIPVGIGLGLLFVPASRSALNATPSSLHGRTSAVLSVGRLLGAAVGAAVAGAALTGGVDASTVRSVLLGACAVCVFIGLPMSMLLAAPMSGDDPGAGATAAGATATGAIGTGATAAGAIGLGATGTGTTGASATAAGTTGPAATSGTPSN